MNLQMTWVCLLLPASAVQLNFSLDYAYGSSMGTKLPDITMIFLDGAGKAITGDVVDHPARLIVIDLPEGHYYLRVTG